MKPNINEMMKKAQKMQEQMQHAQDKLANITVEGTAGGGMVKVVANCQNKIVNIEIEPEVINSDDKDQNKIVNIEIEPEVINSDDKEMLEDLIVAATNQALENAAQRSEEEMQKAMGPLLGNLPGGFKLPGM
jgi:DNA-binding protein YbaB